MELNAGVQKLLYPLNALRQVPPSWEMEAGNGTKSHACLRAHIHARTRTHTMYGCKNTQKSELCAKTQQQYICNLVVFSQLFLDRTRYCAALSLKNLTFYCIAQVIHHNRFVTCVNEFHHTVTANVACSTRDQHLLSHFRTCQTGRPRLQSTTSVQNPVVVVSSGLTCCGVILVWQPCSKCALVKGDLPPISFSYFLLFLGTDRFLNLDIPGLDCSTLNTGESILFKRLLKNLSSCIHV